jgi:hypothetical protein
VLLGEALRFLAQGGAQLAQREVADRLVERQRDGDSDQDAQH